jgi:hypothetical protein
LSGIECWHHTQTPERERQVQDKAERYGRFLTRGRDFHGRYSETPILPGAAGNEYNTHLQFGIWKNMKLFQNFSFGTASFKRIAQNYWLPRQL